jgi:signal transduction histidine kinase
MNYPDTVRLLLVDDRPDNLVVMSAVTRSAWPQAQIVTASSATEGLRHAREQTFDGALIDVHMPEMDGIEMVRALKTDPLTATLPTILITSHRTTSEACAEGLAAGAEDFICRPLDNTELVARLRVMIRLSRAENALRASNERLAASVAEKTQKLRASRDELRDLYGHASEVREAERLTVAREVHDDLGQKLTAAIFEVGALQERFCDLGDDATKQGARVVELLQEGLESVRRICLDLRPAVLDELGMAEAVRWLARDFQRRFGIRCRAVIQGTEVYVPKGVEIAVFRIVQECLANVARHADAESADVQLQIEPGKLHLVVRDDGVGLPDEALTRQGSYGIRGMRERVSAMSGTMGVKAANPGTVIEFSIPLAGPQGGRQ